MVSISDNKEKTTVEKLSELSREYILKNGYHGFSYQDLANELGIKKASIHYYFPSKEDLGKDFIVNYQKRTERIFDKFEKQKLNPKEKIFSYMKNLEYFIDTEGIICPCGVLSAEINTLPEKVKEQLNIFFEYKEKWLEKTIQEGINEGYFKKDINPKDITLLFFSSVQGAIQLARIRKDKNIFYSVINSLKNTLVN